MLEKRKLAVQVEHMQSHPDVDIVLGPAAFFGPFADGRLRRYRADGASGATEKRLGGGDGVLEKAFAQAGFRDIEVKAINAPVRVSSAAECLQFEQESFGALHQMLSGLSDGEQDEAWNEIEEALGQFETNGQFEGPCEMLVAVGTN